MSEKDQPANASAPPDETAPATKQDTQRKRSIGAALKSFVGKDIAAAFQARNWTLTGAAAGALGVVADMTQIFGPIAAIGLTVSGAFAAGFGAIVFMRLKWRDRCVNHFANAVIAAGIFSAVLLIQQAANAGDTGVIAKTFPNASKIQRAVYAQLVGLEKGQTNISNKIDQLTDEVREATNVQQLSKDAKNWVGAWMLESPNQPGWVVTYAEDGTYVFTSPQANLNGVWRASDGLFRTEAPGTGASDAGAYRFRDENTLEMTGKFGMSVWKRIDAPETPDDE